MIGTRTPCARWCACVQSVPWCGRPREDGGRLGPGGRKGAEYDPFSSAEPGSSAKMACHSNWRPVCAEERLARRGGCVRCDPLGTAELKLIHYRRPTSESRIAFGVSVRRYGRPGAGDHVA